MLPGLAWTPVIEPVMSKEIMSSCVRAVPYVPYVTPDRYEAGYLSQVHQYPTPQQ